MIQTKQKEKNTMREKEMKECVCAEPCEGMLEDMPVTRIKKFSVYDNFCSTHRDLPMLQVSNLSEESWLSLLRSRNIDINYSHKSELE